MRDNTAERKLLNIERRVQNQKNINSATLSRVSQVEVVNDMGQYSTIQA